MLNQSIAVAYIARGADLYWRETCRRFALTYQQYPAGLKHHLYVIFKGFATDADLEDAKTYLKPIKYTSVSMADDSLDIGAYIEWAPQIEEDFICPLNSATHFLSPNWLYKLAVNLDFPGVGLVGATGSFESLNHYLPDFPHFPAFHLRSTAFLIRRELFCDFTRGMRIRNKDDAFRFESGPNSLTRFILGQGLNVLLVGRNGRGYSPEWWPTSSTFRMGRQENLLVGDNQTEHYMSMLWHDKRSTVIRTWGAYLDESRLMIEAEAIRTRALAHPNRPLLRLFTAPFKSIFQSRRRNAQRGN